ncbi:alpha/beta hydrolase family protein [Lysinibacillus sp. RS5]|uniref:alpha/beta hydrolase family protein n=1 Tax=unclassified Lysinibacillus TaxID=2636778 RepID=UPI0035BE94EA
MKLKKPLTIMAGVMLTAALSGCATEKAPETKQESVVNTESNNETNKATTSEKSEIVSTDVTVENEGRKIPATLVLPKGEGPFPLVVINHGFAGNRHEGEGLKAIAQSLAESGISSIRMDFAGCGDSTADFLEFNLTNNESDSNAVLNYALKNAPIDTNKLGILGYSLGGRLSLMITDRDDNPYKAMALIAPAANSYIDNKAELATAQEKGYNEIEWFGNTLHVGAKHYEDLIASNAIIEKLTKKIDTVVISGSKDDLVTPEVAMDVANKIGAEFVNVQGADHGYGFYSDQTEHREQVVKTVTEFFSEKIK